MHISRLLLASALAVGVSVPSLAAAQAIPRTTSSEPPASAGTTTQSGGAVSRDVPTPAPAPAPPPSSSSSQPTRSAPPKSGGSSSSGTSSGSSSSGGGAVSRGGTSSGRFVGGGGGNDAPVYVGASSTRTRDGRTTTNTAIRRPSPIGGFGGDYLGYAGYPFSPWGRWYPWYNGGWGWGDVSWDPWRVGTTRWVWGRYGTWWYDPTFWYDPWYDPWFMYGYGNYGPYSYLGGGTGSRESEGTPLTGSLRLRVNPDKAKVYIDGVLQGVVDDFNGLSSHLDVPTGTHMLELKLEGYVTLKDEITVEGGKTQTYRGSLKKSSK